MKLLIACFYLLSNYAYAQSCPQRIQLQPATITSRGESIIYKSNWDTQNNRELLPEQGNHSQKGLALLVHYKAKKFIRNARTLEVRTLDCKKIGTLGRYPRCTTTCGDYERWYMRAAGGSYLTAPGLAEKAGSNTVLIRLQGRQWAVVQNVFSDRESLK